MCYVGKATKIFIFVVTALVVTGLVLGFGLIRHATHKSSITKSNPTTDNDPYPVPVSSTPVLPPPPPPPLVEQSPETPETGSNTSPPPPSPPSDLIPPPSPVAAPPVFSPPSLAGTPGPVQALVVPQV